MENLQRADFFAVAKLGAVRGLKGEIRIYSYSGEYEHIEKAKEILLAGPHGFDDAALIKVHSLQHGGWGSSILFEGFDTPEKARKLVGRELFLPRSQACPRKEGEYYIADLIGMDIIVDKAPMGKVKGVIEGAADDLLEIECGLRGTCLVPFRHEFVGAVDEQKRQIEIISPGFLE